jgi:hypothetical protein
VPELGGVDLAAAEAWIHGTVRPAGPIELEKARPWATVLRVPTADGPAFLKCCRPVQAFEPSLTAALADRWPDRVVEVLAHDPARAWLLTAGAGAPLDDLGNRPEHWLELLPRYAELQRGEASRVRQLVDLGVPDLRRSRFQERFEAMLGGDLPLDPGEVAAVRGLRPSLALLLHELDGAGIGDTIDHADLHHRSVFAKGDELRILDWGDASIGHPFFSLVVTFHWLREVNGLPADDPWFGRLRDAYLEPWGPGLVPAFDAAQRLGKVARAFAWLRHREAMGIGAWPSFDEQLPGVLRDAFAALG